MNKINILLLSSLICCSKQEIKNASKETYQESLMEKQSEFTQDEELKEKSEDQVNIPDQNTSIITQDRVNLPSAMNNYNGDGIGSSDQYDNPNDLNDPNGLSDEKYQYQVPTMPRFANKYPIEEKSDYIANDSYGQGSYILEPTSNTDSIQTDLLIAVCRGDYQMLKQYLEIVYPLDIRYVYESNSNNSSLFHLAANHGYGDVLKLLIGYLKDYIAKEEKDNEKDISTILSEIIDINGTKIADIARGECTLLLRNYGLTASKKMSKPHSKVIRKLDFCVSESINNWRNSQTLLTDESLMGLIEYDGIVEPGVNFAGRCVSILSKGTCKFYQKPFWISQKQIYSGNKEHTFHLANTKSELRCPSCYGEVKSLSALIIYRCRYTLTPIIVTETTINTLNDISFDNYIIIPNDILTESIKITPITDITLPSISFNSGVYQ